MVGTGASVAFACNNTTAIDPAHNGTFNCTNITTHPVVALNKSKNVTLTTKQLTTLNNTQNKLDNITTTVTQLTATYDATKGDKGLLLALKYDSKQATNENTSIAKFESNPKGNVALKIKSYVAQEQFLQQQVAAIEKLLAKQFHWIHFKF
ncbi:MAG: hypothetical protein ACLQG5_09545 [Methanobacterium sp.]|jgi:hypothetical protein